MYLNYNLLLIKKLFERDVCSNVSSFISWYLQDLNGFSFGRGKCVFIPIKTQQLSHTSCTYTHSVLLQLVKVVNNAQKMEKLKNIHILAHLFDVLNFIDEQTDKDTYACVMGKLVDRLILGCTYNIIPISQRMEHQLRYVEFCYALIRGKRSYRCAIGWLWQRLFPLIKVIFSFPKREMGAIMYFRRGKGNTTPTKQNWDSKKYKIHGHSSFCAALSMKGDFCAYKRLLPYWKRIQRECRRGGRAFDGVFIMIALYLRDDLALICENYHGRFEYSIEVLLILLQPCLLLELKDRMINDLMINLTDKEKFNMDLFNNPNLHPSKRIKFLTLLCFSPLFINQVRLACQKIKEVDRINCVKLFRLLSTLIDNFEIFEKEWFLMNYNDLKEDVSKRKELHAQFCVSIQMIFGLREMVSRCFFGGRKRHPAMMISVRPKNEMELRDWYEKMAKYSDDEKICADFTNVKLTVGQRTERVLTFDRVSKPYLLFVKLYTFENLFVAKQK